MKPEEVAARIERIQRASWGTNSPKENVTAYEVAEVVLILSQELTALKQRVKELEEQNNK